MKRKFGIVTSLLISLFFIVGCSGENNTDNSNADEKKNEMEKSMDAVAYSFVQNKTADEKGNVTPGAQIAVLKDGKQVFSKSYGYIQSFKQPDNKVIEDPIKINNKTMFDLASTTKISATTQAVMKLVSEGKIEVTDKVSKYLPDFAKNGKEDITIEQLLTHTSGLPQWKAIYLYSDNSADTLKYINNVKPEFKQGEYKYSDLGFMTLGFIVEEVTGQNLDDYVEKNIYQPMKLKRTVFNPLDKGFKKGNIAVTSYGNTYEEMMIDEEKYPDFGYDMKDDKKAFEAFDGWRNYELQGEVNDGNAFMANNGVAGHAGLFSNASELARIYQTMLASGKINKNKKIYNQDTIDEFLKSRIKNEDGSYQAYGFMGGAEWTNALSEDAFGHNGFTGTFVSVSPKNKLVVVVLTNKMNAGQKEDGNYTNVFELAQAVNHVVNTEYVD